MAIDPNKVAAVFDDWAERGRAEGMERGHLRAATAGFESLEVVGGHRYLDIGCGNGYSVRWAAQVDPSVQAHGIDVSEKMIERARDQSAELSNCTFEVSAFPTSGSSDSLAKESIDCVFSMEVFYYLPDLGAALRAVHNLLKPGGRFVCIVDHYEENVASHSWGPDLGLELTLISEAQWQTAFRDAGFQSIEQRRIKAPRNEDEPTWEQLEGSLLTIGAR